MSFLLDPPALLLLGFLAARVSYLTVAFENSFFTRGSSRRSIFIVGVFFTLLFWVYSSLLYLDVIYFPWPLPRWFGGIDWMLNSGLPFGLTRTLTTDLLALMIFGIYPLWYYLGTLMGLAGIRLTHQQRSKERDRIIREVVRTAFPKGGTIPPDAEEVEAAESVIKLFSRIPPLFAQALTVLLFVFDSRFFVFAFTRKWKRFVDLDLDPASTLEKRKYMEAWESNSFLIGVAQILKLVSSFGYYTKEPVWKFLNYKGPTRPNDPPWYKPNPGIGKPFQR